MSTNIPDPHGRPGTNTPGSAASASSTGSTGSGPVSGGTGIGQAGTPPAARPPSTPAPSRTAAGPATEGTTKDGTTKGRTKGREGTKSSEGIGGSDWSMFRTVVVLVGLILAGFGAYYLILGTAGLPDTDARPVNPTLENQFRFFSAMMVGVGAAFVTIAVKFQWANMLWLVCLMVFAGGIGRVLSWAFSGTPHYLLIILMVVELAFPAALLVWHKYITKTTQMRKDFSSRS
ncbi:DUF4345 domain-containing protein [Arthrobacter crusticola]|uniref:DUF4345 domain-containing protein n=1 Tax=Arthrobacter crusticola TaxID=2547960 RepID=A0A4R5U0E9_9MICC|nr:DUF4345 domain-containing protein [Arthrobacter crusticola]TDK26961.1 DUF4345 domain-containing protein [Arthrobacter crusticola]